MGPHDPLMAKLLGSQNLGLMALLNGAIWLLRSLSSMSPLDRDAWFLRSLSFVPPELSFVALLLSCVAL